MPVRNTKLAQILSDGKSKYHISPEVKRICDMPQKREISEDLIQALSENYLKPEILAQGIALRPSQADGLIQFASADGLFAPIGAGGGKTLLSLLLAHIGHSEMGLKKIMLLVPAQLVGKLMDHELSYYRKWINLSFSVHCIAGRAKSRRLHIARSNRPGLYIYSYSMLSCPDAEDVLGLVAPEMIIADEAHCIAGNSARADRFSRYMEFAQPIFVPMSGTMTSKRISDYAKLAKFSLKTNSFLPTSNILTNDWGAVLDADTNYMDLVPAGVSGGLDYVYGWALKHAPPNTITYSSITSSGLRQAYCYRMATTPGVSASSTLDCEASLLVHNKPVPMPEEDPSIIQLKNHMATVDELMIAPNGDEIAHAFHTFKWQNELTVGFYNELYWPTVERVAKKLEIHDRDALDLLSRSQMHFEAHQQYNRDLRKWLGDNSKKGLDTPNLVGINMHNHGADDVGAGLYASWSHMKSLDFEGRIERISRAVRVCDYKIKAAAKFAKEYRSEFKRGMLFWYNHQEVGQWLFEEFRSEGLDPILCEAGNEAAKILLDVDACSGRIVLATYNSHGTGRNLQYFDTQYFVEWPRPAKTAEQTIAREHRLGQNSDEVTCVMNMSTDFDYMCFAATLNDALYIHQSNGTPQRLILAAYEPRPRIFPPHVLRERGFSLVYDLNNDLLHKLEAMGA